MKTNDSRRRWFGAALLFGLLVSAASGTSHADRREGQPFHWSARMAAGSTLEIHGVNGHVEAGPATGSESVVDAEKWSRHGDPDRVRIEVEEERGRTVIRARYPKHWFGMGADDVNVHFTIRVPRGVRLELNTVNGSIEADGLDNRVKARTVNGGVHIDTNGEAMARTVNGSIVVRAVPRSGDLSFHSINGSVRIQLPANASARLSAHTLNGSITSEFPASHIRGGFIGRSLEGLVGDGAAEVEVHTINGSIRFTRI